MTSTFILLSIVALLLCVIFFLIRTRTPTHDNGEEEYAIAFLPDEQSLEDVLADGPRPTVSGDSVVEIMSPRGKHVIYLVGPKVTIQEIGVRGGMRQMQLSTYGLLVALARLKVVHLISGIDSAEGD